MKKQYLCQYIAFQTSTISNLTLTRNWRMKIADWRVIKEKPLFLNIDFSHHLSVNNLQSTIYPLQWGGLSHE